MNALARRSAQLCCANRRIYGRRGYRRPRLGDIVPFLPPNAPAFLKSGFIRWKRPPALPPLPGPPQQAPSTIVQMPTPANATNPGTPVPGNFPQNTLFMAPDGSQWAYSAAQSKWLNVGVPYNLNPGAIAPAPSSSAIVPAAPSASGSPVSVTISPAAAAPSSYQSVLDWLNTDSVISGVKNFWLAGAVAVGVMVLKNQGAGGRR